MKAGIICVRKLIALVHILPLIIRKHPAWVLTAGGTPIKLLLYAAFLKRASAAVTEPVIGTAA